MLLTVLLVALTAWAVGGPWWPTTLVQNGFRRGRSCWALSQAFAIATLPILLLGEHGVGVGTLIFLVFAPRYVNWRVRCGAWHDDNEATRTAARAIRNRLRDRQEETALPPDGGPWAEYVNDVVRSKRDQVYTPPETVIPPEVLPAE
ncbi:hypothetical protein [Sphingomonas sp. PB1R3]|uniref:hypothetical protein n=1 Tax=Sphingomonas flavida TaxID=3096154 RepID=UPI002FC78915